MAVNKKERAGDRALYDRALRTSHREAAVTLAAAALTALWFWGAVILFRDSPETVFSMPLWFAASCVGGYLFSIAAVILLVRVFFTDIDLDQAARGASLSEEEEGGK